MQEFIFLVHYFGICPWYCCQLSILYINDNRVTRIQITCKNQLSSQCLNIFLDIALQRSCAIYRIITILNDEMLCLIGKLNRKLLISQSPVQVVNDQMMMPPILPLVSGLNIMISSRRFRNSGLKCPRSSFMTISCDSCLISPFSSIPSSRY